MLAGFAVGMAGGATNIGAGIADNAIGRVNGKIASNQLQQDYKRTEELLRLDEKRAEAAEMVADNEKVLLGISEVFPL